MNSRLPPASAVMIPEMMQREVTALFSADAALVRESRGRDISSGLNAELSIIPVISTSPPAVRRAVPKAFIRSSLKKYTAASAAAASTVKSTALKVPPLRETGSLSV